MRRASTVRTERRGTGSVGAARPARPVLERDEVHLWHASLARPRANVGALAALLSDDERGRAERFQRADDVRRFVVARGLLRVVLGRYLGLRPESLAFTYGPTGKPALSGPRSALALSFNVSHSRDLALVAVTRDRRVGVDVEALRAVPDMEAVAELAFSSRELRELRALPEDRRAHAFFRGWTRKEAVVKALGEGLHRPLDRTEVSLTRRDPRLIAIDGDERAASRWSLHALPAGRNYVAAVAVEGAAPKLVRWRC